MQYSLLVISREATEAEIGKEAMDWGRAAFDAYAKSLDAAGVLVSADILQPVAASTTVTVRDGALKVQDGPFADTKDLLGGYSVIDVESLDEALKWAERCPSAAVGAVLVWPVIKMATPKR